MVNEQRLIEEFMELVRVDSETKHEQEISEVLKRKFSALGLSIQEDDAAAVTGHGAGNLFANLPATPGMEDKQTLFFTSHMDTVVPGKGIQPQLDEDGYIRSDGTTILGSDDKAGVAAMLEAIRQLQERSIPHGPLQFIITVGEESGLRGARALDSALLKASYGYALDSNGPVGDIIIAAPAQSKIEVKVYGRAAHAGVNPEAGISAIQVASQAISRMPLGRIDKETTANIGSFAGGQETNIVCDFVLIRAEARSLVKEKLDNQVAQMRQAFEDIAAKHQTKVEFTDEIIYPSYKFEETAPIVQVAARAVERIGRSANTLHSGGGSDANIFNGLEVPTVNLAIGYEHIHTTKEQLPVIELVKTGELVLAIIEEAAKA
jgi:tripeptide aminopeptidase